MKHSVRCGGLGAVGEQTKNDKKYKKYCHGLLVDDSFFLLFWPNKMEN